MIRKLLIGAALAAFATTALAAPGVTVQGPDGTQAGVDSNGLKVDVKSCTGCGGSGTTSNASSGVATSSTNSPVVSYNYGFNGTTWDQLQVDGSKNLKITLPTALPAGTNLLGKVGIDQTTPGTTNGVQVNAALPAGTNNIGTVNGSTVGGYEFNASVIPTVQNAAYAAGQSLGGLQTISIGSTNGLSGILTQLQLASKGGSTVSAVFYVWSKNPSGTTCTDKANFVASQTDNEFLVVQPTAVTPALAVSAQDTATYGAASNLVGNFVNGSSNTDLYVCVLAAAAVTPATTNDLRYNIQGVKDAP